MMDLLINGQRLDLEPETVLALTVQSNDITKPDSVQSTYSNSVAAPFTERNHKILENANEVSSLSAVPYSKLDCQVLSDGVEVIPLPKAYLSQATESYELQLFSGSLNLFERLGDKSIRDLDLSRFDHVWNFANVLSGCRSWRTHEQGYIYSLVNIGKPFYMSNLWADDVFPNVFARAVFEQMLTEAGVSYTGIDDVLWNRLVLPFSNEKPLHTQAWLDLHKAEVDLMAWVPNTDINTEYNQIVEHTAVPISTGIAQIKINLHVERIASSGNDEKSSGIGVVLLKGTAKVKEVFFPFEELGPAEFTADIEIGPYEDTSTYKWAMHYHFVVNDATATDPFKSTYSNGLLSLAYKEDAFFKSEWSIARNLPDIKQKDFLKAVRSFFDLMVMFDPYRNELTFTPFNFLEANKAIAEDWTNKLVTVGNAPVPVQYRFGEFAQKTWFKYQADDNGGNGDAYVSVADEQLETEKDIVTLPFAASEESGGFLKVPLYKPKEQKDKEFDVEFDNVVHIFGNEQAYFQNHGEGYRVLITDANDDARVRGGWAIYELSTYSPYERVREMAYWKLVEQQAYFYDRQKLQPRIAVLNEATVNVTLRQSNNYAVIDTTKGSVFAPISFESLLPTRYTTLQGVLDKAKGITPYFLLSAQDVHGYDPAFPIWLNQYQSYFYLNQITEFTGEGPTECQLWRL